MGQRPCLIYVVVPTPGLAFNGDISNVQLIGASVMFSADLRKTLLAAHAPQEWFVGLGYFTTALVVMAVWLYALASLAAKLLTWLDV